MGADNVDSWRRTEVHSRSVRFALPVVAMIALALSAVFVPIAAFAVDGPTPLPGSTNQPYESWALSPTGPDPTQPGSRATFSYALSPGSTIQDSATVWNFSSGPLTFHVYPADAYNNSTGGFTLLPGNKASTDVGSWISIDGSIITVPAKTKVDIPFTLKVPPGASPGDHTAAILASVTTPAVNAQGHQVTLDRRTGSRVYLRVAGPVNPALVIENTSSTYHGVFNPFDGTLDVRYTIRNSGNIRLGAHMSIAVHDIFGRTVASRKLRDLEEILPGNSVTFVEKFGGVPATVRVGAMISARPFAPKGVTDKVPATTEATTHTWAIPWTLLLVLALVYLLWRLYRRWRDRERPGTEPPGGAEYDGPNGGPASPGRRARQPERALRFGSRQAGVAPDG